MFAILCINDEGKFIKVFNDKSDAYYYGNDLALTGEYEVILFEFIDGLFQEVFTY